MQHLVLSLAKLWLIRGLEPFMIIEAPQVLMSVDCSIGIKVPRCLSNTACYLNTQSGLQQPHLASTAECFPGLR